MAHLSTNIRKNGFRIKSSEHHYFDLKTFWKMSPIFSHSVVARTREKMGEKGTVLRSTLNWKLDASIDQFLSIPRVVSESFHPSEGARVKGQHREIVLPFNIDILPLGRLWAGTCRIPYRVNISTARTKSCVRNKRDARVTVRTYGHVRHITRYMHQVWFHLYHSQILTFRWNYYFHREGGRMITLRGFLFDRL